MAAPFTLEQFTGVNNQLSPEDMGKADLAACINFDVNDSGSLVGRPGLERVWTGDAHSLAGALGTLFFRSQDKLLRLDGAVATEVDAAWAGRPVMSRRRTGSTTRMARAAGCWPMARPSPGACRRP